MKIQKHKSTASPKNSKFKNKIKKFKPKQQKQRKINEKFKQNFTKKNDKKKFDKLTNSNDDELDDFEQDEFNDQNADSDKIVKQNKNKKKNNQKNKNIDDEKKNSDVNVFEDDAKNKDIIDDENDLSSLDSDGELDDIQSHKKTLESLKNKDPEFYEYLKTHDKELLEFGDDDEQDEEEDIEEGIEEQEDEESESSKINLENVKKWRKVLQTPSGNQNCLSAMKSMIKAFRKAVHQTLDMDSETQLNVVMNPTLFNLIINACLLDLSPALTHFIKLKNFEKASTEEKPEENMNFIDPRRSRNWKRIMPSLKMYLTDVMKFMYSLSIDARISFERHVLELMPFYQTFPHLLKRIIRRSIQEWYSCDEERSRVLAFLILYRSIRVIQQNDHMTKTERQTLINHILRQMYLAYAVASKTTNETTLNKIRFMRNSLVELYNLEPGIAYQQAFIFMRQLAINLRKSLMNKEKDSLKRVFNWQFVHSVNLWSQLIGSTLKRGQDNEMFLHLLTPIANISLETLRVFSAFKYVPFRLHLLDALIKLAAESGYFVPALRIVQDILNQLIKNKNEILSKKRFDSKKTKTKLTNQESLKSKSKMNLDLMLKFNNKGQSLEMKLIEQIVDKLYEHSLYYLKSCSHFVSFPEMILVFYNECRKKSKLIPYQKGQAMLRQLLDKCDENAQFIIKQRLEQGILMQLKDSDQQTKLDAFERELKHEKKTPLLKFYEHWRQFKTKQIQEGDVPLNRLAEEELMASNSHEFNVGHDLHNRMTNDDNDEGTEDDDEDDDEICLTEEQLKKLQKEQGELDEQDEDKDDDNADNQDKKKKRKRKKQKRKNQKKARSLNPNLDLEGAFDMSSDDD